VETVKDDGLKKRQKKFGAIENSRGENRKVIEEHKEGKAALRRWDVHHQNGWGAHRRGEPSAF